jgi:hypothetical protein
MVTDGFSAPRARSVLLSGGNTDGASGPGVGSATIFVQEGGVGMMMFGVGDVTVAGDAGAGAQAGAKVKRNKMKEMSFLDIRLKFSECLFYFQLL